MSQDAWDRGTSEPLGIESGLAALQASPAFRGPVEPLDGEACNEHMTLIYEDRDQQRNSLVPFLEQGLDREERCLYVSAETAREDVLAMLRSAGVEVDAALKTDQLSFHAAAETYLRDGAFDVERMLAFYEDAIAEATAEYEGLRVAADTSWILEEATDIAEFMRYESEVNGVFDGADAIALCQYDRGLIPDEVLVDIVRTHPHIVYDNTVCHNFYYLPPEELFGPNEATHEVDRMLGTLADRTQAKADLKETIDQLEQSNQQLQRFAYVASHDLQEPLRMVSSYLQLLEERYGEDLDPEAREFIEFAVDGADRMREMVDDLLAYSRMDRSAPTFDRVDTEDVLASVLADLTVRIDETDAEVTVGSLPTVVGDRNRLETLFRNLVSNAVKYRGDDPPRIEVDATRECTGWRFAVVDNGIGIDPDHTEQIFEIFNRLHGQDDYSGTGIGLALCRRIVEDHDGDIRVESEPGVGSTFYVSIPDADERDIDYS